MRALRRLLACAWVAALGCAGGAPPVPFPDAGTGFVDSGPAPALSLRLYRAEPPNGPFTGATLVTLRGDGFEADAFGVDCRACGTVRFGDRVAAVVRLEDAHRLVVQAPAGVPGSVDVSVQAAEMRAVLPGGYTYDAVTIEPTTGSVGGGTYVTLTSAAPLFDNSSEVRLDGAACSDLVVADPTRATCFTPPGVRGPADLVVVSGATSTVPGAFTYEDPLVPGGGLGGGPFAGTLDVVVHDLSGPVEGATVMAGERGAPLATRRTDARGRATFAGPELTAPLALHVAAPCHDLSSFVGFDARRATVFLVPDSFDPACEVDVPIPRPGGTPPVIDGQVMVDWASIPLPGPRETRVARVFATRQRNRGLSPQGPEDVRWLAEPDSQYVISALPGALAVIALAGIEDATGRFTPHRMGIARGLLLLPEERRSNVDVRVDIPLDRELIVELAELPDVASPPPTYRARAVLRIDEGFIAFEDGGVVWGEDRGWVNGAAPTLTFPDLPRLEGALADGRYDVMAEQTDGLASAVYTRRIARGVPDGRLRLGEFLSLPVVLEPMEEEVFTGRLRFEQRGPVADVTLITIFGERSWRIYAAGDVRELLLPGLEALGLSPPEPGTEAQVVLSSLIIPGVVFSTMRYAQVDSDRLATHVGAGPGVRARW